MIKLLYPSKLRVHSFPDAIYRIPSPMACVALCHSIGLMDGTDALRYLLRYVSAAVSEELTEHELGEVIEKKGFFCSNQ